MAAPRFVDAACAAALLALSACADADQATGTTVGDGPDTPVAAPALDAPIYADDVPAAAAPTHCNADRAAHFIGQRETPELREELRQAVAPVETIRWVGPGDATTEDYSPSRLNVMLDAGRTIRSVHCG